jgi:hypothetical protein
MTVESAPDESVRRLLHRIAAPAALATPDLPSIGAALAELAADLDYVTPRCREVRATRHGSDGPWP